MVDLGEQRQAAHRTLTGLQTLIEGEVQKALTGVADEFAREVHVDPSGSPPRLRSMWRARLRVLVRSLLAIYEAAVAAVARWLDLPPPAGYSDLPDRYQREPLSLPPPVQAYTTATQTRLGRVGDDLWDTAAREVAASIAAGETPAQRQQRLRRVFSADGSQLGDTRAARIARTETMIAWNTAVLAAIRDLPDDVRPRLKGWLAVDDPRTRPAHRHIDGTVIPLGERFNVNGDLMDGPGDPTAPVDQLANCRCVLLYGQSRDDLAGGFLTDREVKDVTSRREGDITASTGHTSAMIALVPSAADADRLAVNGGEPADQLHLTLFFLGDADAWPAEARDRLVANLRVAVEERLDGPVVGNAFGANHWNAGTDSPSWVWAVGDDRGQQTNTPPLVAAYEVASTALNDIDGAPEIPAQHSPWVPHVCAAYSTDPGMLTQLEERLGPITFDRLRVAFGPDDIDIPLGTQQVTADGSGTEEPVAWSTPGDTAIAFEDTETGDGRIFASGALYWDQGPWPLQYADEMLSGHDGAELSGSITTLTRDGRRITGSGLLYPSQAAGWEAIQLLREDAPLGVSVDLDDVDIELVDRSNGGQPLVASFASATVTPTSDGGWAINATHRRTITATAGQPLHLTHTLTITTGADRSVPAEQMRKALTAAGVEAVNPAVELARLRAAVGITAAAGDPDTPNTGTVVHSESSGDLLVRITRARVRGATLVAVPAFAAARITLDATTVTASDREPAPGRMSDVVTYVAGSPIPVSATTTATALGMTVTQARDYLARAASHSFIVRLTRGLYIGAATHPETRPELAAAVSGDLDLPIHPDRDHGWDGNTAASPSGDDMDELEASAWREMRSLPPMPAEWFRQPTAAELPPDSGGVHYRDGRIYGWVAQAGVPHQGFPDRRLTIDSLGNIELSHFLRAKFRLDDGSTVRVGAFTMNVGHHRDSAECETAACQFDDTRTVAGIVTVGINNGGMWFSGAAAPWLSDWDRQTFLACQPSYHMKRDNGRWSLRAVLSVPVPGHPSRLAATAVVDRANMALAASAATPNLVEASASVSSVGIQQPASFDVATIVAAVLDELDRRAAARDEVQMLADRVTAAATA